VQNTEVVTDIFKAGKGKAVPLQAWSGPEGSRKLRFPDRICFSVDVISRGSKQYDSTNTLNGLM